MNRSEVKKFASDCKKYFPILTNNKDLCYLDSGATSLKPKCVLDKMNEYYENYGVNIHRGVYKLSYDATNAYDIAREKVAKFINADFNEVVFTKNVSESLNDLSLMLKDSLKAGDEVLTSVLEHHSSVLPWLIRSKEIGLKLTYLPLNDKNRLDIDKIEEYINPNTKIIALGYVSNVLGYKVDMKRIIEIAHKHNVLVIVDAAQAIQHFPIDVKELDCDFLCFSGHKMFGPMGVGVLYGKKKHLKKMMPVYYGGDMNEEVYKDRVDIKDIPYRFEVGTPAIAEVIGLGEAVDFISSIGYDKIIEHNQALCAYIEEKFRKIEGIELYNDSFDEAILSFNVKGVHPHDASSFLDEDNICVRAGHHCAQLLTKYLGLNGTVRASFSIFNDFDDVDKLADCVKKVIDFFKEFN